MLKTEIDEKLGPVETGPPRKWLHYGDPVTLIAYCGARCVRACEDNTIMAGERLCPDCLRIAGGGT